MIWGLMGIFPLLFTLQVTGDHLSGPYSENLYYRWVMGKWVDVQTSFSSRDREAGWESLS